MQFTSNPAEPNHILSCSTGAIHLRDKTLSSHAILSADTVIENWNPAPIAELSINDFSAALDLRPDVILFGTGLRQTFPDLALLTEIMRTGVAIEVMDTAAACRTFNVLIGENRAAVAALLLS